MRFKALLAALAFSLIAPVSPLFADTMIPLFDGYLRFGEGDRASAIFLKDRSKFYLLPRDAEAFAKASVENDLVFLNIAGSGSYGFAKSFQQVDGTRSFCTFNFDEWLSSVDHDARDEGYVDRCIVLQVSVARGGFTPETAPGFEEKSGITRRLLAGQLISRPDGYPRRMSRDEAVAAQNWKGEAPLLPGISFFTKPAHDRARFYLLFPFEGLALGDGVLTLACGVDYGDEGKVIGPCDYGTQRYPTHVSFSGRFYGCACEPKDKILQQLDAALAKTFADYLK